MNGKVVDAEFASRLSQAFEKHLDAPSGRGRQKWLLDKLQENYGRSFSGEAASKWFAGEARPRVEVMRDIAEVLNVDEAWLSLGIISTKTDVSGLSQLGQSVASPTNPDEAVLERVPSNHASTDFVVRFTAPEFTSLCPMTGQPDFAHIVIDYVPDGWLVESKSLKLYLHSFRNHGAFHEDCTIDIAKRLVDLLSPKWLRIGAYWYPRGGIPIDVFWQTGAPPEGVWLPDQGVQPYRGRG